MTLPIRRMATGVSRPTLPRHVRLHFDPVRQAWALLSPEKILWPDETSLAILRRCDGSAGVDTIADELAREYGADAETVRADVVAFLQDWSDRMVVRL